jgi:hypothetical protein
MMVDIGGSFFGDLMFVRSKKIVNFVNKFLLLSESLTEAPASNLRLSRAAASQGLEHYGNIYYGPKGKRGKVPATHKSVDGKIVPLTAKEKQQAARDYDAQVTPTKKPASRLAAKAAKPTPTVQPTAKTNAGKVQAININIDKVPGPKNHPLRKDPIFLKFLQNPTKASAQYLQDTYNMMFNNNKLYVGTIMGKATSGDAERKPFGESPAGREFGRLVAKAIRDLGVDIPAKDLDASAVSKKKGKEAFKATNLFGKDAVQLISAEGFDGGVKIGSSVFYEIKYPQNFIDLVMEEARKNHPNATAEQLKEARNIAESSIKIHQHKIEKLKQIQDLPAYRFTGTEGARQITTALINAIRNNTTNDDDFQMLRAIVNDIFYAKDVKDLFKSYAKFINNAPPEMSAALPYVSEIFSAIHQVHTKGEVIIPADDSYKLVDMIGLGSDTPTKNPIELANKISFVLVDTEDIEPEFDLDQISVSTKLGEGSASSNYTKYEETEFYTDYSGKKYTNVKSDLLAVSQLRKSLFSKTESQPFRDSKTQIFSFVENYKDIIADYYGLDRNIETKDIVKLLSTGKPPICGPNGSPVAAPELAAPLNTNPANAESWQLWSVLGYATDAVHNKMVNFQNYSTHVYKKNGAIHIADGLSKLSASKFKFYKNLKDLPDGNKMPNQELNAFTVPATRANIRNGNPCQNDAKMKIKRR